MGFRVALLAPRTGHAPRQSHAAGGTGPTDSTGSADPTDPTGSADPTDSVGSADSGTAFRAGTPAPVIDPPEGPQ
ncbi:hypothetical protein C8E95_6663 [Pseudonocardia autotrophica]|uniref:Uncharacterized protein n=2 Tax=Pseudonocardia TaxID=1847 RepID=A0A1Y2N5U6_PSEAH|nr:hypothetical protein BG845_01081 [Pseudonocardia autotrophica]TDN77417.1 hypothetical protein C8E95_6663 [Pseudonocardia autotrophica]BBG01441.1 hypothetical protein Pdca_26500 [Pseudonocardia autotrophica]GEC24498.1 hypothetical protein PSA01_15270 [Pseudonocardia saturnea]